LRVLCGYEPGFLNLNTPQLDQRQIPFRAVDELKMPFESYGRFPSGAYSKCDQMDQYYGAYTEQPSEVAFVILPEGGDEECIEEAISTCPVECISWEE
jgi:ferredoxin